MIGNDEIKLGKKQSPAGLSGIESLGFTEVLEVFVICDDGEGMVSSLQPMPPLL